MQKTRIDKTKFILNLLEIIPNASNIDDAITENMINMKIKRSYFNDIKGSFFPDGLKSLMIEINEIIDMKLRKGKKPKNFANFRINEKIKYFVIQRIQIFSKLVHRKFFFKEMLKPNLFLNSYKILFKIADEIWFLSGDKSTDFNYYTKRLILMNVYAATFSYFFFDKSENFNKTKSFLDKQIKLVLAFGKLKQKIKKPN